MVGVSSKWCRQWQSIRRPSFWQSVVLCLLSSRFHRIEHQTRWTCTALWPRSIALRIRSLPHEGVVGTARHRRCGGNHCLRSRSLARSPSKSRCDHRRRRRPFQHRHPHARGVEARQNGKLQAQTSMRTASNQARKHCRGLQSDFNRVCTCEFGSVTRTSWVRPSFSCQLLICIPLLSWSCFWNL